MPSKINLLIVGNGAMRLTPPTTHYVNRHTSNFLHEVAGSGVSVKFAEPEYISGKNCGLSDGHIDNETIEVFVLSKRHLLFPYRLYGLLCTADFCYLFFPGTWSRVFSILCILMGKPYGLYIRGENFRNRLVDRLIVKKACFVLTVTGIAEKAQSINRNSTAVAPMLEIGLTDFITRTDEQLSTPVHNLLFVGRVEREKGVLELCDAVKNLNLRGANLRLTIVGGGPLLEPVRREYSNPENEWLQVTGLVTSKEELNKYYRSADVLLLPTWHEGFPRVLFEAMAAMCCIVTTMVGGIPAIMKDGVNCLAVAVRSPASVESAILRLINEDSLRMGLAKNAQSTFRDILNTTHPHFDTFQTKLKSYYARTNQ